MVKLGVLKVPRKRVQWKKEGPQFWEPNWEARLRR